MKLMTLTAERWKEIAVWIPRMGCAPNWLLGQMNLGWEIISRLPKLDNAGKGKDARPLLRKTVVTASYLNFLRTQIALNPRGPEWQALLQKRLAALEPHLTKKLWEVSFHWPPYGADLKFLPGGTKMVSAEMDQEDGKTIFFTP